MIAHTNRGGNWLGRFGLLVIAPVILLEAAIFIVVLSLPVAMGLAVGLGTVALLALGATVTAKPETRRLFAGPEGTPVEMVEVLPIRGWTHRPANGHAPVAATVTKVSGAACPLGAHARKYLGNQP